MSSTKHTVRLIGAFAALAIFALAASCRGFFVNPTLTAINIAPSSPQVEINNSEALSVYGTYNDGSTAQVKSGVSWSSDTPAVAAFANPTSNLLEGVSLGTATITANAQAVTATATVTVFLGGVTKIVVSPTSGSFSASTSGSTASFTATATANGKQQDITVNGAIWTITPANTTIACVANTVTSKEDCSDASGQTATPLGNYTLTAGYPGTNVVGTATLTVTK